MNAPQLLIRRRCGHTELVEVSAQAAGDSWLRWALAQERRARCAAAWLERPSCEGRCTTGPLDPSTLALLDAAGG